MGARGPVGAREEDLARPRSRKGSDEMPVAVGELMPTKRPPASKKWSAPVKRLYVSLGKSGQVAWYQDSDWAYAWFLCDQLDRYQKAEERFERWQAEMDAWYEAGEPEGEKPKGGGRGGSAMKLKEIMAGLNNLLITEADRRRVRIELRHPESESLAEVIAINDARKALGVAE